MKKMVTGILIAVFAALPVFASEKNMKSKRLELAKNALVASLKSDNDGVRNSAIHIIAQIKAQYPTADLSIFNKKLTNMAKDDSRSYIRANANLTYIYINSADLPYKVKVEDKENPAVFFNSLYSELNQDFIALNF
jgi:hypothetical protein